MVARRDRHPHDTPGRVHAARLARGGLVERPQGFQAARPGGSGPHHCRHDRQRFPRDGLSDLADRPGPGLLRCGTRPFPLAEQLRGDGGPRPRPRRDSGRDPGHRPEPRKGRRCRAGCAALLRVRRDLGDRGRGAGRAALGLPGRLRGRCGPCRSGARGSGPHVLGAGDPLTPLERATGLPGRPGKWSPAGPRSRPGGAAR